ncbi:MAG: hypothetical protein ACRC9M_06635, partial [Aeromonas sp.]
RCSALTTERDKLVSHVSAISGSLDKARSENGSLTKDLELARASLARADVANKNALDAQAATFAEQHKSMTAVADGMVMIPKSEALALRKDAKELGATQAKLATQAKKLDGVTSVLGAYRTKINNLEQLLEASTRSEERAGGLLKEMAGRCELYKCDLDYAMMAMRMFNQQPEYKSDTGRLTIMALSPEHLQSEDILTISPNTPLCWWNTKGGLGCVTMLSAGVNENGERFLIFPSFAVAFPGLEETVDIVKEVMPPEDEWPAIIEHMSKLDSAEMTKAMDAGSDLAERYAAVANPNAKTVIRDAQLAKLHRETTAALWAKKNQRTSKKKKGAK